MMVEKKLPPAFIVRTEVSNALRFGLPVVSLESTVITHGLPRPENLELALSVEEAIRHENAVPARFAADRFRSSGRSCVHSQSRVGR